MAVTEKKWYVLRAGSGKEAKVKEYMEAEVKHNPRLAQSVAQVLLPMEKHATLRCFGQMVAKDELSLPG